MKYISSTRRFIPVRVSPRAKKKKQNQKKKYSTSFFRSPSQIRSRPVIGPESRSGEFGKIKYFRHPTETRCACFAWSSPPPREPHLPAHASARTASKLKMYSQAIANVSAAAFAGASSRTPRRALSPRATIVQTTFTPFVAVTRIGDGASPRASRARVVETTGRNTHDDLPSRFDAQPPPPRPARRLPRAPPRSASPPPKRGSPKERRNVGKKP